MLKDKGPVLVLVYLQLVADLLKYVADLTIQYLRFLFALSNPLLMLVLILRRFMHMLTLVQ